MALQEVSGNIQVPHIVPTITKTLPDLDENQGVIAGGTPKHDIDRPTYSDREIEDFDYCASSETELFEQVENSTFDEEAEIRRKTRLERLIHRVRKRERLASPISLASLSPKSQELELLHRWQTTIDSSTTQLVFSNNNMNNSTREAGENILCNKNQRIKNSTGNILSVESVPCKKHEEKQEKIFSDGCHSLVTAMSENCVVQ